MRREWILPAAVLVLLGLLFILAGMWGLGSDAVTASGQETENESAPVATPSDVALPEANAAHESTEVGAPASASLEFSGERHSLAPRPSDTRDELPPSTQPAARELAIAGDIRGQLLSESGPWRASDLLGDQSLVIELVRLGEPQLERRASLEFQPCDDDTLVISYIFKDVPEGEYELSLFQLGSWQWLPQQMRVRAPSAGHDFVRYDKDALLPLEFVVVDARTGESIQDFEVRHLEQSVSDASGVFMHAGPLDLQAFPRSAQFRWSLWAEGYRPRFGDERALVEHDGKRIARVELERGWAASVVVLGREPTLRPLLGVPVKVDDHFVGATDHNGALILELAHAPERIEVTYKNWVLENDPLDPRPGTSPELRGHVLPLILHAPE